MKILLWVHPETLERVRRGPPAVMGSFEKKHDAPPRPAEAGHEAPTPEGGPEDSGRDERVVTGFPPGGWIEAIGLALIVATPDEVVAEWSISARHLQPQGIVHGGVYASVVETCCSVGALLAAPAGKAVVGVENHTSFVRPVREGRLRARAVPLHAGRRAQLWECSIVDTSERLIATGRLRVLCVDARGEQER